MNPEWRAVVQEGNGESVHISSHPAVKTENEHNAARRQERLVIRNDIDDAYGRALKNANKGPKQPIFGRTKSTSSSSSSSNTTIMGPRGEDHADHWGKTLPLAGPWASETVVTLAPQMYPAPPGIIHTAPGQPGACAAGTCGGSTGCGSGAVALCGAGCSGVSLLFSMPILPPFFVLGTNSCSRWAATPLRGQEPAGAVQPVAVDTRRGSGNQEGNAAMFIWLRRCGQAHTTLSFPMSGAAYCGFRILLFFYLVSFPGPD